LGKLNTRAAIDYATSPDSVLQTLAVQPPQAVFVTDCSITQHRNVYAKLLDYVHAVGILVLMGDFSSSIKPDDLDKFFREQASHGSKQSICAPPFIVTIPEHRYYIRPYPPVTARKLSILQMYPLMMHGTYQRNRHERSLLFSIPSRSKT
jgi:hypothetical protein